MGLKRDQSEKKKTAFPSGSPVSGNLKGHSIWTHKCNQATLRSLVFKHDYTNTEIAPSGMDGKESACNAGDPGSIPSSGRSSGEGNGCPLWYSCLENPMDREAWWATVHVVAKGRTRLSEKHFPHQHKSVSSLFHLLSFFIIQFLF